MKTVIIYTDGACVPNPGLGSWAYAEKTGGKKVGIYSAGVEENTTNNRMEFKAALQAIKDFADYDKITIFSDSQLLVNSFSVWVWDWAKKGFPKRIKNRDLVLEMHSLLIRERPRVEFRCVRGHNGDYHNTFVDRLCAEAVKSYYERKNYREYDPELAFVEGTILLESEDHRHLE